MIFSDQFDVLAQKIVCSWAACFNLPIYTTPLPTPMMTMTKKAMLTTATLKMAMPKMETLTMAMTMMMPPPSTDMTPTHPTDSDKTNNSQNHQQIINSSPAHVTMTTQMPMMITMAALTTNCFDHHLEKSKSLHTTFMNLHRPLPQPCPLHPQFIQYQPAAPNSQPSPLCLLMVITLVTSPSSYWHHLPLPLTCTNHILPTNSCCTIPSLAP